MIRSVALLVLLLVGTILPACAQSLHGSHRSMVRQNRAARRNDFTFLRTPAAVRRLVEAGRLVRVRPGTHYRLAGVSYPYAREETRTFIRRLADQYYGACGLPLVVTSLTRPLDRQPENASSLSVHPAGMAVDLRRSSRGSCRRWLESALLELEGRRVLEATRERHPAHYHVAVFPQRYSEWVERQMAASSGDGTPAKDSPSGS